jgi:transposase, IS5 family
VAWAKEQGLEAGRQVRVDATAVETHIHHPVDSALLNDCVRVLTREMEVLGRLVEIRFADHQRRARRRALAILNARRPEKRKSLYRDLIKVTRQTAGDVRKAIGQESGNPDLRVMARVAELERLPALTERVIDQTRRRVFQGETVPAGEKLVSIFEEHTDIIRKRADPRQSG